MKTSHIGYFEHRLVVVYLQYNCKTGTTNTGSVLSKNIYLFTQRKRLYDKDNFFLFCYKFNFEINFNRNHKCLVIYEYERERL